ncbi:hypothetical protein M422DRAFT_52648 [Sphaerobolus stellatus SS14]|uniref:Uncharacterized protein n=1 Tax=Sphaerobolus stellatus (strain SS14) TaxID=990650 RepID=A0A0C9UUG3_SPHS4|nr:hypothetical protein M422DRAFT_52648 [Sphaerobolus stellatus SS14]
MSAYYQLLFRNPVQQSVFRDIIVNIPPITDNILGYLAPYSLTQLAQTCQDIAVVIAEFSGQEQSIHELLSDFVQDPFAFRRLQAKTGCIISGLFPLQFFSKAQLPCSDIMILVRDGSWEIQRFLCSDGYTMENEIECCMQKTRRIFTCDEQGITWDTAEQKTMIHIIVSSIAIVMNIITALHAISLYPRATFEYKCGLVLHRIHRPDEPAAELLKKYQMLGFNLVHSGEDDIGRASALDCVYRRVGDDWSWVIRLQDNIFPSDLRHKAEEHDMSLFAMQWQLDTWHFPCRMKFRVLSRRPLLSHDYVIAHIPRRCCHLELGISH